MPVWAARVGFLEAELVCGGVVAGHFPVEDRGEVVGGMGSGGVWGVDEEVAGGEVVVAEDGF